MIGCGSMGGGMALLFAEDGVQVGLSDPSEEAMDAVIEKAEKSAYNGKVKKYTGQPLPCSSGMEILTIPRLRLPLQITLHSASPRLLPPSWRRRRQSARGPHAPPLPRRHHSRLRQRTLSEYRAPAKQGQRYRYPLHRLWSQWRISSSESWAFNVSWRR